MAKVLVDRRREIRAEYDRTMNAAWAEYDRAMAAAQDALDRTYHAAVCVRDCAFKAARETAIKTAAEAPDA